MHNVWKTKRLMIVPLLAILIVGGLFTWWMAWRTDHSMRENLLAQAELVVRAIDVNRIKALTAARADLSTENFQYLQDQLTRVKAGNAQCKYLYLMARSKDGNVVFLLEAKTDDNDPSLPGDVYEEASEELRGIFDTGRGIVEGPLPDEWGVWVSAIVPITDPDTGKILAVLGMDIDASSWTLDIAASVSVPVCCMLVLLLVIGAGIVASRPVTKFSLKPIQRRLLIPSTCLLLLLVGGFLVVIFSIQKNQLEESCQKILQDTSAELGESLREETESLSALENVLLLNPRLMEGLVTKNSEVLRETCMPLFEMIQKDYDVTGFNVYRSDRTTLFCAQDPEKEGDRIDRFTLTKAQQTGKNVSGIEIDSLGRLTFRVVQPAFQDGECIGYLELAKGLESFWSVVAEEHKAELAVAIQKTYLDREQYEAYLQEHGLEYLWDSFPDDVIVYSSCPQFFVIAGRFVGAPEHAYGEKSSQKKHDGKTWRIMTVYLNNASGTTVGDLFILKDITAMVTAQNRLFTVTVGGGLILLAGLLGFLFVMLRRTDDGIRRQQAELAESEERYDLAMSVANDGIWDWRLDTDMILFDRRYYTMAGYDPDEFPATLTEWEKRVYPDDLPRVKEAIEDYLLGQSDAYDIEHRFQCKNGEYIWIQSRGKVVTRDEHDMPLRFVGTHSDVTERKTAKEKLRETNRRLEVTTKRANEMAAQAENASQAKGDFLASMSHEIRTPMNGIIGMTELLLEGDLTEQQRQYAEMVQLCCDQLLFLINDILDFSKIEAGKLEMEEVDFHLPTVVEEVPQMLKFQAENKGLDLTCSIAPEIPALLRGDPGRLRQILINLVNNSLKFTLSGEVAIHVRLEEERQDDVTVRFQVRDTGIGIPADRVKKLFQPFTQVDGSMTRKYGGTGLGLAISKQLAEMMGGRIGVESVEEEGSTFWFTAVLAKQAASKVPSGQEDKLTEYPAPPVAKAEEMTPLPADLRILIVEDNVMNQKVLLRILKKKLGLRADVAVNGIEAIRALTQSEYDIVLMDCQMPGMDGYEATRSIRNGQAGERNRLIPIIAITAHAMKHDREKCQAAGMNDYLAKPIAARKLIDAIHRALNTPANTAQSSREG